MKKRTFQLCEIVGLVLLSMGAVRADSLIVGFNTSTPIQTYSLSGSYQQDFGPSGASSGVVSGGYMFVTQPDISGTTVVSKLDADQNVAGTFSLNSAISDGAPGLGGTVWFSSYDGTVYHVSDQGAILSSFSTGFSSIGVASDGTYLYTTRGDASDGIDKRNLDGSISSTIFTGISGLYGIGYDAADSSLFAGSFNYVYQFSADGSLLNTLDLPGDARTPNGSIHDGLEVGDLSSLASTAPPSAVPEPSTLLLTLFAGTLVFLGKQAFRGRFKAKKLAAVAILGLGVLPLSAAVTVSLTSTGSSVPVGSTLTWSAVAQDSSNASATFTYQFSVRPSGTGAYSIVKDFYTTKSFDWTPSEHEGAYDIQVTALSSTGQSASTVETATVTSRISGNSPVVSATRNPLVALYSAPPCDSSVRVRIRFKSSSDNTWQVSPYKNCNGLSVNFYVAGMRAGTAYSIQQESLRGFIDTPGPSLSFTTGAVNYPVPSHFFIKNEVAPTSISYPFLFHAGYQQTFVTDANNNVVWYLPAYQPGSTDYLFRVLPGGYFTGTQDDRATGCRAGATYCGDHRFFREFDLAGSIVHETNWSALTDQINKMRAAESMSAVHLIYYSHDGSQLPNGDFVAIVTDERIADQGQGPVDVLGDAIAVYDSNFNVKWFWDSFDFLDLKRKALGNDTCANGQSGCPILFNRQTNGQYYSIANDWTHVNSATYDARDGNLIVSVRHQSWVIKIAYQNGTGNGHVMWRLGKGGDFSLGSGHTPDEWFSYQHDAGRQANGLVTLFDNNNENASANSRGQAWQLDESKLVATPVVNVDLGVRSPALGSAALLSNGNYTFGAGLIGDSAQAFEFTFSGTLVSREETDGINIYRYFRLPTMYGLQ